MNCILGIDLGTSSVKAMLLDPEQGVAGVQAQAYTVEIPQPGYAQQQPEQWWDALCKTLAALKEANQEAFARIQAVGLSGQMHGLVLLDQNGNVLRPAILWLDQRSEAECMQIRQKIAENGWDSLLENPIFPGFAFPSLLWVKKHEPLVYEKIACVMQPKDYIRYRLTGLAGAEVTDASASLLFAVGERQWADPVLEAFGIDRGIFADCHESMEIAGSVTAKAQEQTGLKAGIPVIYGAGDQQCQSIGNGVAAKGQAICNIGTGGQISVFSDENRYDPLLRTHTFCHCFGQAYTIYGAMLCAGMALDWLKNKILHEQSFAVLSEKAGEAEPGSGGLLFLPYLAGERTPHMNANAAGMFFGLKLSQDERHMARAVMEGVTFALKDSLGIIENLVDEKDVSMIASGGACASPVWLQMQADIFNRPVRVCRVKEQACLGAAVLAGVGSGILDGIAQACQKFVAYDEVLYEPDCGRAAYYEAQYEKFCALYGRVESLF